MRIGQLSRRTGVAIPTIKYYVREGLLPPGELSSPNQATYGPGHERRLRLIRALITLGGLPVATVREVLDAVTSPDRPVHKVLGVAQKSITPTGADLVAPPAERAAAERRVAELIERRGWRTSPDHPAARTLADTLAVLDHLGHEGFLAGLDRYAEGVETIAEADLAGLGGGDRSPEELAEKVVVGTLLGDTALAALRRLAQQDASARHYGGAPTVTPDGDEAADGAGPPDGEAVPEGEAGPQGDGSAADG